MKKITAIIALLLCAVSMTVSAQTKTKELPGHRAFIYAGTNFMPQQNLSYSSEFGTWGIKSNLSYSATFDFVPQFGTNHYYVGAKAYYTLHNEDAFSLMSYLAPKFAVDGTGDQIIEFGVNPNYTLNNDFLLAVTLGNQVYNTSQWNFFASVGVIYLFRKQ